MNPALSILICHLPERKVYLDNLMFILSNQVMERDVEIIIADQPRGMTIGDKRNYLVNQSKGEYVCFVDDDDQVSSSYVEKILKAIRAKPDCVGITGKYLPKGGVEWSFRHSITVQKWCKDKLRRIYYRTPNHLNPIKRELVVRCPFPSLSHGEDHSFSNAIRPLLKTEVYVEYPIYHYYFVKDK